MKWLRYRIGDQEGFGTIDGDEIRVHAGSMFEHPRETGIRLRLSEITWLTPCVPSKMLALWNNFNALAEKNGWMKPPEPLYFNKAPNSFAAHGQQIVPPPSYDGRAHFRLYVRERRDRTRTDPARPDFPAMGAREELRHLRRIRPCNRNRL